MLSGLGWPVRGVCERLVEVAVGRAAQIEGEGVLVVGGSSAGQEEADDFHRGDDQEITEGEAAQGNEGKAARNDEKCQAPFHAHQQWGTKEALVNAKRLKH